MLLASDEEIKLWNDIYKYVDNKYHLPKIFNENNVVVQTGKPTSYLINTSISLLRMYGFLETISKYKDYEIYDLLINSKNKIEIYDKAC